MNRKIWSDWDVESILALTCIKGLGYAEHRKIVEKYSSYAEFISNAFNFKQGEFFAADKKTNSENIDKSKEQVDICGNSGINIVTVWDENYPILLKNISSPPTVLFVKGKLQVADSVSIAVVGTRKNTNYGKLSTELFVSEFVKNNIIITSGLAYGTDSSAHSAAMKQGGITYAVIASGIDKIFPQIAKKMADEIVDCGGAIISEYKCGTVAVQGYFPQRNRIISGISQAVLIMESALKGGSLITARFASDQGKEVYALPGNISLQYSTGCNELIRANLAAIAISPQQILDDLGLIKFPTKDKKIEEKKFNSSEEELIYNCLSSEPMHIDNITQLTNLNTSEILVKLLDMEFDGLVRQLPGKYYVVFNM